MDVLSSAEFRRTYAKLTEPTVVTANGHVIGEWTPRRYVVTTRTTTADAEAASERRAAIERFNTQPFRGPIPKKR